MHRPCSPGSIGRASLRATSGTPPARPQGADRVRDLPDQLQWNFVVAAGARGGRAERLLLRHADTMLARVNLALALLALLALQLALALNLLTTHRLINRVPVPRDLL
jgi:hypothetical protein